MGVDSDTVVGVDVNVDSGWWLQLLEPVEVVSSD